MMLAQNPMQQDIMMVIFIVELLFLKVKPVVCKWVKLIMCGVLVLAGCTRKTRIIDVVYNASNNELVRTKTLVKNCVILVDSAPFRQWYESHYALPLGRKKGAKLVCFCQSPRKTYTAFYSV